jgi:phage shock protein PspC (stress-responsive transcriptional regulator)
MKDNRKRRVGWRTSRYVNAVSAVDSGLATFEEYFDYVDIIVRAYYIICGMFLLMILAWGVLWSFMQNYFTDILGKVFLIGFAGSVSIFIILGFCAQQVVSEENKIPDDPRIDIENIHKCWYLWIVPISMLIMMFGIA